LPADNILILRIYLPFLPLRNFFQQIKYRKLLNICPTDLREAAISRYYIDSSEISAGTVCRSLLTADILSIPIKYLPRHTEESFWWQIFRKIPSNICRRVKKAENSKRNR